VASAWGRRLAEQLAAVAGCGQGRVLRRASRPLLLGAPGLLLERGGSGGVGGGEATSDRARRHPVLLGERAKGLASGATAADPLDLSVRQTLA
jgi:hypothetical protein